MKRKTVILIRCVYVLIILIGIAIAIPSFVRSRNTSSQQACINNLRIIEEGKAQAMRELNQADKQRP